MDTAHAVFEQLITRGYISGRPPLGTELVKLTSYRSAILAGTEQLGRYMNDGGRTSLTNSNNLLSIDGLPIEMLTAVKASLSGHTP